MVNLDRRVVLVTGGTGSFGQKFTEIVLRRWRPKKLIIFSRDELKQHEMRKRFPDTGDSPMRYFLGDVRDPERLQRAFHGVEIVIHAAALKQVPACEYNPFEAVLTNILGAKYVIDAAIDQGVQQVLAISTDKAVNPINLYGATKLCAEKLFVHGNFYVGEGRTRFSCARYGNVIGSRGSVIPAFLEQRQRGRITVTDQRMTRFWLRLEQGVEFVLTCLAMMRGGEVFVPKIPSMRIVDVAKALDPTCEIAYTGIRPGEKLHEVLIAEDEARNAVEYDDFFAILPWYHDLRPPMPPDGGRPCPDGFRYSSETNPRWLSAEELREMIGVAAMEPAEEER